MRNIHEVRFESDNLPPRNVFGSEYSHYEMGESLDTISDRDTFARIFIGRIVPIAHNISIPISKRTEGIRTDFDQFKKDMEPKLQANGSQARGVRRQALKELTLGHVCKYIEERIEEARCRNTLASKGYNEVHILLKRISTNSAQLSATSPLSRLSTNTSSSSLGES